MSRYRRSHVPGATFFFTVALADRFSALLTEHIDLLRRAYGMAQRKRPFDTIAICVLPEHLHAIWELPVGDADYSIRWMQIKANFSRHFPASTVRSESKSSRREKGIWQRRYWEHQIRDEQDLERHVDYIHYNPIKHGLVTQLTDWPYSSFHRYVVSGWLARDWAADTSDDLSAFTGERV